MILWGVAASQAEWKRSSLLRPIAEWLGEKPEPILMGKPMPAPRPTPHPEMGEMVAPPRDQ